MRTDRPRARYLAALAIMLTAGGVALTASSPLAPYDDASLHLNVFALFVAFVLAEVAVVHVPVGRETHSFSFAEIPLALGLLLADAPDLAVARVAGALVVNVLVWRQTGVKLLVNLASWTFHVGVAVALYPLVLDGVDPLHPLGWAALLVTVAAADVAAGLSVQAAISLHSGHASRRELWTGTVGGVPVAMVNSVVGLVAVLSLQEDPEAGFLLGVLIAIAFFLYRGYHLLRLRHGRLELLYQFTKAVNRSMGDSSVAASIHDEARRLMRAQTAGVLLACDGDIRTLAGDGRLAAESWWRPALTGTVVRHPRRRSGDPGAALSGTGHVDGLAVPLHGDGTVVGALVVADRLDAVSTFDSDDLKLLESLAGHAGVALANDRLVERVREDAVAKEYIATHDQLTGLPNRLYFQQHLGAAVAEGEAAVLLMDIDRFKEVNDTLGHDVGDLLLVEVAARVTAMAGDDWTVARLGGDEFAVLVTDGTHGPAEQAVDVLARELLDAASVPFRIGDLDVQVRASMGVALAPEDGTSPDLLLRRAEIAMYDAKSGVSSVARYTPGRDPYSPRRLTLAADLDRALYHHALDLHYQPQIEVSTGRVVGVEALLRWNHPLWGHVPPDEFVSIATRTGLIHPLTQFVLKTALRTCAHWRAKGLLVTTSVNVSMLNLLEPDLAQHVADLQRAVGLPGEALVLEITESEIMAEPERSIDMLHRIVALGAAVSVDDFGTGHSSLTHLRSLPVSEVKVDREFVRNITASPGDAAIVRSVVELGHNLGLRVVAEGVEDEPTMTLLREWGCDLAQGYLLASPMSAEAVEEWLFTAMSTPV